MADEKIKIKIETDGVDNLTNDLEQAGEASKNLKTQLREATLELQKLATTEGVDPNKVEEAAKKVGELRDAIADANEQANLFAAGSKYERVSGAFGEIQSAIANLDFEKAAARAKSFANIAADIKFGDAIQSAKQLGQTFMSIGKALLTNPLFLLAAVIVAIVAAIVKLLKETGLLKVIMEKLGEVFDFLMIPINALIAGIKKLTDWFGWTANAAEESAERQAAAAEKAADAQQKAGESRIQSLETQIRLAEAEGKSTEGLERKKLQEIRKTAEARAKADRERFDAEKKKGDLSAEEIAQLKETARQSRLAFKQAADDVKVFQAELKAERQKASDDKKKEDAESLAEEKKAAADAYKERLAKAREFASNRLAAERQIEDLKLEMMADGIAKELEANRIKYERLREDTLASTTLIQSEKDKIIKSYNELEIQNNKELVDKKAADDKAVQDKKAEELVAAAEAEGLREIEVAQEIARRKAELAAGAEGQDPYEKIRTDAELKRTVEEETFQNELLDLQRRLDEKLLTEQEYNQLTEIATTEHTDRIGQINEEAVEKEKELNKAKREMALQATMGLLGGINDLVQAFAGKSEAAQKKAFKVNQAFQIAQATIDTIKGGISAFTGMVSQIPGPVGIVLGAVAAAGVVASGIASIKKIASTKFQGTGGGGAPSIPAASAGTGGGSAPTPPSLTLSGQANEGSQGQGDQQPGLRQQPTIKAVVVESDITKTQNRLATYQQRSEIG